MSNFRADKSMITPPMKAPDAIIKEWAERHDLQGTLTDLRACFDDARSLSATPPVDTSTAGEWTEEYVRAVLSNYGESHLAIDHNASLAALREQLAQAKEETKVITNAHKVALNTQLGMLAALKQKDEALALAAALYPKYTETREARTVSDNCAKALAIQPDSSALKTVIEAETAKLREALRKWQAWTHVTPVTQYPAECRQATDAALAASAQKAGQP